jgi:hypothetical protein
MATAKRPQVVPVYPRAAELYQIARDLVTSSRVAKSSDGQVDLSIWRIGASVAQARLVLKGRALVKGMEARGERVPPGIASVQWFDAAGCFLKAWALNETDEGKRAALLWLAAFMDALVVAGEADGVEYVPDALLTGWMN